jgi:hypothetical protein
MLKLAQLHARHAFAQHSLKRIFPASLDMKFLPQPAQAGEFMAGKPGFQRALLLDVILQLG